MARAAPLALAALAAFCVLSQDGAADAQALLRVLVKEGGPSSPVAPFKPDASRGGTLFDRFASLSFAGGDIVFQAGLRGGESPEGLFVWRSRAVSPLLLIGGKAPGGGEIFNAAFPRANATGAVVFIGSIRRGPTPGAVFVVEPGGLKAVAAIQEPAPGGGTFWHLWDPAINGSGVVAFAARVHGGEVMRGIFLVEPGKKIRRVVAVSDPAPGGGSFLELEDLSLGGTGALAFTASLHGETGRSGVFLATDKAIRPLALGGQPAPSGGRFLRFASPRVRGDEAVAFWASVVDGPSPAGVFLAKGSSLSSVVRQGEPAPGGGVFSYLELPFAMNDAGDLAFVAAVRDASASSGVFVAEAGGLRAVALEGQPTPEGGAFLRFASAAIGPEGLVAFVGISKNAPFKEAIFLARGTSGR